VATCSSDAVRSVVLKRKVWERTKNYPFVVRACQYARSSLLFIHLCDVRNCTQEICVKRHIFKSGYYKKKSVESVTLLRMGTRPFRFLPGPDLPIGCVNLSLGPQDPREPPANCGTHRVSCRFMIALVNFRQNFVFIIHEIEFCSPNQISCW